MEDDDSHTQFRRSQRLIDGLAQASEAFRASFNIDARGLARSYWAENEDELVEVGTFFFWEARDLSTSEIGR